MYIDENGSVDEVKDCVLDCVRLPPRFKMRGVWVMDEDRSLVAFRSISADSTLCDAIENALLAQREAPL